MRVPDESVQRGVSAFWSLCTTLPAERMRWLLLCSTLLQALSPAQVRVVIETELGSITVEVDAARAPATAANFLRYVDGGFYEQGRFHRAVRPATERRTDVPIQAIQGAINPSSR